jgi:predicted DNA-binding transcriptional regulator YafY
VTPRAAAEPSSPRWAPAALASAATDAGPVSRAATGARRRNRSPEPDAGRRSPEPDAVVSRHGAFARVCSCLAPLSRNDRIARLFRLLNLLVQTKRGLILRAVADKEGWKLRSLYRDIEALEKAGFPLVHEDGRYRLMEGWIPAVQLGVDRDELLALYLARQQAEGWRGTEIGEALERLYGKLAAPPKATGVLVPRGLGEGFSATMPMARDYAAHRKTVATLDRAIRERLVVSAVYESLDGETTRRDVEPVQLHWDSRLETLYLIGYCRLWKDTRVFATHRFRAVSCKKESFAPRADVSSETALRHAFRVWRDDHVLPARLSFTGRAARLILDRKWHATQRAKRQPGGEVLFEAEVAGAGELLPWILSFGAECTVVEPEELRERVREEHVMGAERNGAPRGLRRIR